MKHQTGWPPMSQPPHVSEVFNFCHAMHDLCTDICARHPEFRHIDMRQIAVTYAQARSVSGWGRQAKLTPLRFQGGARTAVRNGRRWAVQRLVHDGREMLYILTFYLPRFQNQSYTEKLITVFHELYHVGPRFDGDIRRFSGSCYMHTGSQAEYDRQMARYVRQYLRMKPPVGLREFLRHDFSRLCRKRGAVVGLRVPIPRLIPIRDAA